MIEVLTEEDDAWEQPPLRSQRSLWFWLTTGFGVVVLFLSACFVALYFVYAPSLSITADRLGGRDQVSLRDMPKFVPSAFIATEDRRFYSHGGVDYRGLVRAFFRNWAAGGVVQGGSTITQQLAKNAFLTNKRTWRRKLEEVFLSFWLERHYSKDEIMTLYLNRIYLGSGAYGVDAAARKYFDKSITDVSLAEAAMLAALTTAPTRYAPDSNLEGAQERAAVVINLLYEQGYIDEEQAENAKANPAEPQ